MRIFKTFFILHTHFIVITTDDSRNIKQKRFIFSQGEDRRKETQFMQPRWLCSSENVLRILKLSLEIDAIMRTKSLPQESMPDTEISQCYISKNAQPKCSGYTLDTTPSSDVTKKAERNDLAWSVTQSSGLGWRKSKSPRGLHTILKCCLCCLPFP